jgi:hypothetical protein
MVPLTSLWLPIVLAAVLVFVASSVIHMMLTYHRTDYAKVPREDQVLEALRPFALPPGDYFAPHAGSPEGMRSPDFVERMRRGPVLLLTVLPSGPPQMGGQLAQWFVYCLVVSVFAAYVTSRALPPGAAYLDVSQLASTTAFVGYALAMWQNTIWYKRRWTSTLRST